MGPLGGSDPTATIVVAASCIADVRPRGIRDRIRTASAMAWMRRLAQATGVRLLGRGGHGQRHKIAYDGKQQQESGSQAMHASGENQTRIKPQGFAQHRSKSRKPATGMQLAQLELRCGAVPIGVIPSVAVLQAERGISPASLPAQFLPFTSSLPACD